MLLWIKSDFSKRKEKRKRILYPFLIFYVNSIHNPERDVNIEKSTHRGDKWIFQTKDFEKMEQMNYRQ